MIPVDLCLSCSAWRIVVDSWGCGFSLGNSLVLPATSVDLTIDPTYPDTVVVDSWGPDVSLANLLLH